MEKIPRDQETSVNLNPLARRFPRDETMGIRAFGTFSTPNNPKDNWGMVDLPKPKWIDEMQNAVTGRVFLFGTGPSLVTQKHLLPRMVDESTWTCNRMKHWGELPFKPTVHCVTEPGPLIQWGISVNKTYDFPDANLRIAISWTPVTAKGWLWCPKAPDDIQMRWEGFWGTKPFLPPLPSGWPSPLTMSQLAAWFGHTEFYFLGIDTTHVGQAWDVEKGRTKHPRNVRSILESFDRAKHEMKVAGRAMYDCTPGGRINQEGILEYRDLEEVLNG